MFDQPFFHIALLVPDIDEAIDRLSAALGISFREPTTFEGIQIDDPDRRFDATTVTFSVEGPPYIELIQAREGVYGPERMGVHHIGMFSPDSERCRERLEAMGVGMAAKLTSNKFRPAYYTDPDDLYGLSVEIVHNVDRPALESWLGGAADI